MSSNQTRRHAAHADELAGSQEEAMHALPRHVPAEDIPASEDLCSGAALAAWLAEFDEPPYTVLAGGDIMLGDRSSKLLRREGPAYPFAAVRPLLRRAGIVLGNQEGPLARAATREERFYAYQVDPDLAGALTEAGITVVTLANNHLVDCGRDGVMETLEALAHGGVAVIGAGLDERAAHAPFIREIDGLRIGLLGYYWNRRCAATAEAPGSAMDGQEALEADIERLRRQVDRVVVTFHWGIPYEREPLPADREKARWAIDCGADAVIGHHPHIVQPLEVYRDRPIFYSVGNFTFGSGNSQAEGLLVGLRFTPAETTAHVYPIYVKNRDPRVNYQPKVLRGAGAAHVLDRLAAISGESGPRLERVQGRGTLRLPWTERDARREGWHA